MKITISTFLLILFTLLLFVYQSIDAQTDEISKLNKALTMATVKGDTLEVETLLQEGADADAKSSSGQTVLMYASMRGHTEIVQLLLSEGADVNVKNTEGVTALQITILRKFGDVENLLRNAGAKN